MKKEKGTERKWFYVGANPKSDAGERGGGEGREGGGWVSKTTGDQPAVQQAVAGTNWEMGTN